ncbi:MAG: pyridoxal phosphate-dependent aminotransferase [Clostridia bacterium]|nr:pyridoxal phosphate-dependent aminotransferase [Clostridia bacterium]
MADGIINKNLDVLKPSVSIEVAAKAKKLQEEGREILPLTLGEPNFDTPRPVVDCAIRELLNGNTHYAVGRGIPELRERIAEKLRKENGIKWSAGQVIVTPGAKYAIYLAIRTLINEGDEAIIPCPCWVSYSSLVTASGGVPVELELDFEDNYSISEEKLESVCTPRTKLLILNSPNNPTGHILTREEIDIIRRFVLKHDLYIVSDEIYEKIVFDGRKNISPGAFDDIAERVVTVNGFSKFVAMTGWRIGYLTAPPQISDKIYMLFQHTITCIPGFTMKAACVAFECVEEAEKMRQAFENRRNRAEKILAGCSAISFNRSEGAFYMWLRIRFKNMNSLDLSDYLLEKTGVIGVPGEAYGPGGKQCIRFSLAVDEDILEEGLRRVVLALGGHL